MMPTGGKLTALACNLTKKVNKAEEQQKLTQFKITQQNSIQQNDTHHIL
jgi:hypothetical protein